MVEYVPVDDEVNAHIIDVANYFLLKKSMSNKKIQKLCFYAEAWSLVLLDSDIAVDADFEAWVHGPVSRVLYENFKGFGWKELMITPETYENTLNYTNSIFSEPQKDVLESVWMTYGDFSADELESITHTEEPWKEARVGYSTFQACEKVISRTTMKNYYSSIYGA